MAYDQTKLISDVRIYLGGIDSVKLPDTVITYWGDFFDADPRYTSNSPFILWKTTLCCIEYLKASVVTSTTASKTTRKEKVGDVQVDQTDDYGTSSDMFNNYDDLYKDYLENPWKFGIKPVNPSSTLVPSIVHINGVDKATVDKYRGNRNTTSIYNPLPTSAFSKDDTVVWERRGRR